MTFYTRPPESIEYAGNTYALDLRFWRVLAAFDALSDNFLDDFAKLSAFLEITCPDGPLDIGLFNAILELIKDPDTPSGEPASMDIKQDWELVYSAFIQAYQIDLYKSDMHWFLFRALLKGIPQGTRLADVIRIRTEPIPAKGSLEAKANLMKLKARYALKKQGGFQDGLNRLFDVLKAQAERGKP